MLYCHAEGGKPRQLFAMRAQDGRWSSPEFLALTPRGSFARIAALEVLCDKKRLHAAGTTMRHVKGKGKRCELFHLERLTGKSWTKVLRRQVFMRRASIFDACLDERGDLHCGEGQDQNGAIELHHAWRRAGKGTVREPRLAIHGRSFHLLWVQSAPGVAATLRYAAGAIPTQGWRPHSAF